MSNYDYFMKLDVSKYPDKWIAIVDGELITAAKSFKEAFDKAKKLHPKKRPFITRIPGHKAMIL
ncbi:MAG: DUF5678 domain-containing protein [Candidatus Nanoarchaeia archaeon]